MTSNESFTHGVRDRMTAAAARPGAPSSVPAPPAEPGRAGGRSWAAEPVQTDESILENTGHTWDEWADLIDAGPGRQAGHTAIAAWVHAEHGVDGWWAQGVTVGYERITGLRLPGQMPDGSFSVSRTKVLALDRDVLRALLLDEDARADLVPGVDLVLRSKPAAKALRFTVDRAGAPLGSILFSTDLLPDGRLRLGVTHDKVVSFDEGEHWKLFWSDWLAAVEQSADGGRA
ncbi:hypothetical protein [Cryobacterium sp. W22_MBD10_FK3]|uniref:hypothetical protein n=1 Tax=Cryobacterium sp. W22_MBD10_FK3 TaxID=3240273 RepID=UPI003F904AD7